ELRGTQGQVLNRTASLFGPHFNPGFTLSIPSGGLFMNIALTALLVLCSALPAFAQDQKGWIDVNFGAAAAAERSYGVAMEDIRFFETARFEAAYEWTRGANFDFGGGYMFTPLVGAGLSFSGTAHRNPAV